MNIKQTLISLLSAVCLTNPAVARIEDGTADLIKTLDSNGVTIVINDASCDTNKAHGVYSFVGMKRQMTLCPRGEVTAKDHETVRHETAHAIQHCINMARGTAITTPIDNDRDSFLASVQSHLSDEFIAWIVDTYPEDHWYVEAEAFMMAELFTADELSEMFLKACTM